MDSTLNEEENVQYFDEDDVVVKKVTELAELVKSSKYFVTYTGAGISTAAGIPDFRGPEGVWTLKAKGQERKPSNKGKAVPTMTHMALVSMMNCDYLKFLVSQNCDGLHIKSGISPSKISELHGNTNIESCAGCGKLFYRSHPVRTYPNAKRLTGRRCDSCNIPLRYTTVAFGQSMPDQCYYQAKSHSKQADLTLCLGTSMRVMPACELPVAGKKNGRVHNLVIVNLQKTPYDDQCAIRIFAKVDVVMELLMDLLKLPIPKYEELNLSTDEAWLKIFSEYYKFREPSTEWFEGDLDQSNDNLYSCAPSK